MNLNIVPIEYDKRGLDDIARIIHKAFPFFQKAILKKPMPPPLYEIFLNRNEDKDLDYFLSEDVITLLEAYQKPVLGIISFVVVQEHKNADVPQFMYGGGIKKGACFVSNYLPELSNCEEASRRVGIECIHELGHVYGLEHHIDCKEIPSKSSLCPMEINHRIFCQMKEISRAQYFDARKTEFCDECKEKLKNVSSQPANQFF